MEVYLSTSCLNTCGNARLLLRSSCAFARRPGSCRLSELMPANYSYRGDVPNGDDEHACDHQWATAVLVGQAA